MKRRDVLRRTCGALAVGATAGCLSSDGGGGDAADETNATDTTTGTDAEGGTRTETEQRPTTERATERERSDDTGGTSGRSIETTRTDCRSEDDADAASVTVGADDVEITGTVVVADPCHAAAFGSVECRDGELVAVVAPEADDEVCTECTGVVDYAATIPVDDPPETVTVKHRNRGRTRTVETAPA